MERIDSEKNAINLWLPRSDVDDGTWEQITNTANHPDVEDDIAVMPDTHLGYGVAIGTVARTRGSVIPNAVGVDIGCGVTATRVPVPEGFVFPSEFWLRFANTLRTRVPTGFNWHTYDQLQMDEMDEPELPLEMGYERITDIYNDRARRQFASLGGGNHYLEVGSDEQGNLWFHVHSGSRAIGHQIAQTFHNLAVLQEEKRSRGVTEDLAALEVDTGYGEDYVKLQEWAREYASLSRRVMVDRMWLTYVDTCVGLGITPAEPDVNLDSPHNYVEEDSDGFKHRKGATDATLHRPGIIPGSMGTPTFIVSGKGHPDSLYSASHGAGRAMSRRQARKTITIEAFAQSLSGTQSAALKSILDEAPAAYKPIEEVMRRQADLVSIEHVVRPIITLKGDSRAAED